MTKHYIDAETVHNWIQRYRDLPYFNDLSVGASIAIAKFNRRKTDMTAGDYARYLCETFPVEFLYG
ncbi:hypothetical protein LCGC14_0235600 [marine sediment metagenome]|uniref:Uncharacterized protein n=1 Tax=marine sediment metagenome TaxID=412755 RepID=A0A0F9UDG9_9ZZZZ